MKIEEDRIAMAITIYEKWLEKKCFYMLRDSIVKSKVNFIFIRRKLKMIIIRK